MAARGALLGIGTLHGLEILDPETKRVRKISAGGRWLGWNPQKREFVIARRILKRLPAISSERRARMGKAHRRMHRKLQRDMFMSGGGNRYSLSIARNHERFHGGSRPRSFLVADIPTPVGRLRQIGLLKALVYRVPQSVKSPDKNQYAWHHAFGDTGHNGGDRYPERVMPALCRDSRGNLFIRRRKGNIFRVDTWLRG